MPKQTPGKYIMYVVHDHLNFKIEKDGALWVSLANYTQECLYKEPEQKSKTAATQSSLYDIESTEMAEDT
ncbi:hypothetical protein NL533_33780, partial [Klebsiella pneumoniae]|nr:hypothetical protein [Klebsiella pneumoniae]